MLEQLLSRRGFLKAAAVATSTVSDLAESLPFGQSLKRPPVPTKQGFKALTEVRNCVAFAPPDFNPQVNQNINLTTQLKALQQLFDEGFRCIVFYASDLNQHLLAPLAKDIGFKRVYLGLFIFNLTTYATEYNNALTVSDDVDGYVFGNEALNRRASDGVWLGDGVGGGRFTIDWLIAGARKLRRQTGQEVAICESMNMVHRYPTQLRKGSDALLANCQPYFSTHDPVQGVQIAVDDWAFMESIAPTRKPVLFRECWWPSGGGSGATEANQTEFFRGLLQTQVQFLMGASHERPWMNSSSVEPFFGLHRNDASWTPKPVISQTKSLYWSRY